MTDVDGPGGEPRVRVTTGGQHSADGSRLHETVDERSTGVTVTAVGSTGVPEVEPLVTATLDGETAFFGECGADRLDSVIASLEDGSVPTDGAMAVTEHEPQTTRFPAPSSGPLGVGTRLVTAGCGWLDPTSVTEYRAVRDPFLATRAADDPASVRQEVASSDLRGRGRGDASADRPVAADWETVADAAGDPVVVVNANEADSRAAGDRLLVESAPLPVLDSGLAAATALDATDLVVYLNERDALAIERVEAAATALTDAIDAEASVRIVTGPDEYRAGEPTMALEAIEGNHRLEARRRPPGPSEYGLDGRPTLIHTPRTFAQVGRVLAGDERIGASSDPGTRLLTVAGDVAAPATVEVPTDETLDAVLPAVDPVDGHKAACVGGVFGGLTRSLDVPASAPGLEGARLGTNGVVELLGESTCVVSFAGERAKFASEENCGRCAPCREGSKQLVNLLRDVYDGEFADGMLRELTRVMRETSLCGFGADATRPVTTAMEAFETEFDAHANQRCPTGTCTHS